MVKAVRIAPGVTPVGNNSGMARTHGTRSAYNAGCRCDDCREASRVARARQRAVLEGHTGAWDSHAPVASDGGAPGPGLVLAGLLAIGTGGYAVWHGATLPKDETTDLEERRRSMVRWIVGGMILVGLGALAIRQASR